MDGLLLVLKNGVRTMLPKIKIDNKAMKQIFRNFCQNGISRVQVRAKLMIVKRVRIIERYLSKSGSTKVLSIK